MVKDTLRYLKSIGFIKSDYNPNWWVTEKSIAVVENNQVVNVFSLAEFVGFKQHMFGFHSKNPRNEFHSRQVLRGLRG